jgi:hypothetical protein
MPRVPHPTNTRHHLLPSHLRGNSPITPLATISSVRYSVTIGTAGVTSAWKPKSPQTSVPMSERSSNVSRPAAIPMPVMPATSVPVASTSAMSLFSCKTRFCPSCGRVRVDNWVNDIARYLLEVPHFHITLTTDDLLWSCFFDDRSRLKILLQTAARVVREMVEELYPGVRIGMIYTTHTYGRDLGFKPHVHLVMTKGGLKDGKWVEIDAIPAARLAAKWRYLLCKHLRQARPHERELHKAIDQGYCDHRGYQVHTDSFYPEGLEAARYFDGLRRIPLGMQRGLDLRTLSSETQAHSRRSAAQRRRSWVERLG